MLNYIPKCYTVLGCTSHVPDSMITKSFDILRDLYPKRAPEYMDALLEIAKIRKSSALEEFAVLERSKGIVSLSELQTAYNSLGGGIMEDTPSRRIVDIYRNAVKQLLLLLVGHEPRSSRRVK
jgi:hypothetical protein